MRSALAMRDDSGSPRAPRAARPKPVQADPVQADRGAEPDADAGFVEAVYLAAFPDVAEAVKRGLLSSAAEHYRVAGRMEQRLQRPEYRRQLAHAQHEAEPTGLPNPPGLSMDAVAVTESGAIFIAGWADDRQLPLASMTARLDRSRQWSWHHFPRLRRRDVESALGAPRPYQYGFWLVGDDSSATHRPVPAQALCRIEARFASGVRVERDRAATVCSDAALRDMAMGYLAHCDYHGNHAAASFAALDKGGGDWLIGFNRAIGHRIATAASVQRFGPQRQRFSGSIVVPLYGIGDYLFVQNCLYAQGGGIADYEFIYVVNSPDLTEALHREARIAEMIYGLSISLVTLPGNAGFGAANNIGLRFARSDRILCINPDVFPRDPDWAQRHSDLVQALPAEQTRLFGTSLYYDDGALMHGGMYFEIDSAVLADDASVERRPVARVEHYGKGAPPWATQYVASRPVPAVTGAFMSIDRAWFEQLGGFTEDYVFGHYEDADLCLKSLRAGTPAWLHDIPMWHLEGKGSRRQPAHEGGSLLNRWLFTRTWEPMIVPDLVGRTPRALLRSSDAAAMPPPEPSAATRARGRPAARLTRARAC